jgi:hypothetical protein
MPAVYCNRATTTTGVSPWVDISAADFAQSPPHIQIAITGDATVKVEGTVDPDNADLSLDYSNGGFTASDSRKLIQGIRFWRTNITANAGSVTAAIGEIPMYGKGYKSVNRRSTKSGTPVP